MCYSSYNSVNKYFSFLHRLAHVLKCKLTAHNKSSRISAADISTAFKNKSWPRWLKMFFWNYFPKRKAKCRTIIRRLVELDFWFSEASQCTHPTKSKFNHLHWLFLSSAKIAFQTRLKIILEKIREVHNKHLLWHFYIMFD